MPHNPGRASVDRVPPVKDIASMIKRIHWQKKREARARGLEHAMVSFPQMAGPGHDEGSFAIR